MQTYELAVTGRSVALNGGLSTLVRTSIGVDQVHVLFDNEEWLDFPVTATFANGEASVTQSVAMTAVDDGQYAAEATIPVPWEVIQEVGGISVAFAGTDASDNHIVTAASGTPLTVDEAGEIDGSDPTGSPTTDEWHQAYAQAVQAGNDAATLVANLQDRVDAIVTDAEGRIDEKIDEIDTQVDVDVATTEAPGIVQPDGETITVDEDGVITAINVDGMTDAQKSALANLQRLAAMAFDSVFEEGVLQEATVDPSALPLATQTTRGAVRPDGESLVLGQRGLLSVDPEWVQSQLDDIDGAFTWEGFLESRSELPAVPRTGMTYIVGGVALFWDGLAWSELTPDMSGYVAKSEMVEITPAMVHAITGGSGEGGEPVQPYVLPPATDSTLGGIKVGSGLRVAADGTLSLAITDGEEMEF